MDKLRCLAKSIAAEPCQILHQEDVFFQTGTGRLKLRILSDTIGKLIHYERPNTSGIKLSSYLIYETSRPDELRNLLAASLGEIITVKKKRELYITGQTRIHLDEVDELGSFMELEVVLNSNQIPEDGRIIASELMKTLSVNESDLVPCAYADLLLTIAKEKTK